MRTAGRLGGWLVFLGFALAVGLAPQPAQAARYALLVGIDHYSYGPGTLPSCINDANGFRSKLLWDTNRWTASRISTKVDSAASKTAIRSYLQSKASSLVAGDQFVYFHSSHGGSAGGTSTYLCSYNANYTDTELGSDLARFSSGVKVFVLVDACFSGGLFKGDPATGWDFAKNTMDAYRGAVAAKMGVAKEALPNAIGANIAFMTAADYNQTSGAGSPYSVWVKYVLESCASSVTDTDHNGLLKYWEVFLYAKPRASAARPAQTAQYYNYSLLNNNVLVALRLPAPVLVGPTGTTVARPIFSWVAVPGAHHYRVQIFSGSTLLRDVNNIAAASWQPATGLANGSYTWRACAYPNTGERPGDWSTALSFAVNPSGAFLRRVTLTWGASPVDLDSHLKTPTGSHIYFGYKGSQTAPPYAQLDVDDVTSYGPENISIYHYLSSGANVYKYYIHQWSSAGTLAGCGARVVVLNSAGGVSRTYYCPTSGSGRYWYVFNMTAGGAITAVNQIVATEP